MDKKENLKGLWGSIKGRCQICGTELNWNHKDCSRYIGGWTTFKTWRNGKEEEIIVCWVCDKAHEHLKSISQLSG